MQESLTWKKSLNVHELICLSKTSGLRSTVTYSQSLQLPQTREPKIIMELRTKLIVILAAWGCGADTKNTGGRSFQNKQAINNLRHKEQLQDSKDFDVYHFHLELILTGRLETTRMFDDTLVQE